MRVYTKLAASLAVGTAMVAGAAVSPASGNELVIYSSVFARYADGMAEAFEAANPGVTVHVINPGGTEAILVRLEAERDSPRASLMHSGGSTEYLYAKEAGLIEPIDLGDLVPESVELGDSELRLRDPDNYFYVFNPLFTGLMVNTQQLERRDLPMPTSWADLLDPVYEGHIVSASPLRSSTAVTALTTIYANYGHDEAVDIFDRLHANIGHYVDSTSQMYALTARGEFAIALVNNRPTFEYMHEGYPVEFVFPTDGSMIMDNSVALVKDGPNPELARQFMEFLFSPEWQANGAEFLYTPAIPGVLDEDSEFYFVSLDNLADQVENLLLPEDELQASAREVIAEKWETFLRN